MGVYEGLFPLGLGTNRFLVDYKNSEKDKEIAARIVTAALENGVDYIDTAINYSNDYAPDILKRALRDVKKSYRITTKVSSKLKTAEAAKESILKHLDMMGLKRVTDIMLWSVMSYAEFEELMKPGGVYEGALELKNKGYADHITLSTHAPIDDIIKIIEADIAEGIMVSMSLLDYISMRPALDKALEYGVDVAIMNPLGGGMIAKNQKNFSFVCNENEDSVIKAALRFLKTHPAVKLILAGPSSETELMEDICAFKDESSESDAHRVDRVVNQLMGLGKFCTGCKYCMPCPANIQISRLMQSRNMLLFGTSPSYRKTNKENLEDIQIFKGLSSEWGFIPENSNNPCIGCRACERKCTQHLNIVENIKDMYNRIQRAGYSIEARKDRLNSLLNDKNYKKVAVWPAGAGYATTVVNMYNKFFGKPDFEFVYFNSSKDIQGKIVDGRIIYGPDDLLKVKPDCVLVVSYTYGDEIEQSLQWSKDYGIEIIKLHEDNDVPWVY